MKKQFSVAAKRLIDCLVYLEQSQETVYIKYDGSNHKF